MQNTVEKTRSRLTKNKNICFSIEQFDKIKSIADEKYDGNFSQVVRLMLNQILNTKDSSSTV